MNSPATADRPSAAHMLDLRLRLARRQNEAAGIDAFEFEPAEGGGLPAFEPGSHLLVEAAPGVVRSYSLCNDPAEQHRYVLGVLREPISRGGSAAMHQLKRGQVVRASRPRNAFPLAAGARRSLLIAGGIGITPLLAMAEHLLAVRADFLLHYCVREVGRAAFLPRLHEPRFDGRWHLHLDDAPPAQRFEVDRVLSAPEPGRHLYVCGPAGFMDHVLETARRQGWSEAQLHREYFNAPLETKPAAGDSAFELVIASTGQRIAVDAGESALQALERAGVQTFSSCQAGVCGSCVTPVLQGTPDHRDTYLGDEEKARNDCFMPCCSRARTPELVLDL